MASTAFLNFLRYPHGRTVDGINYEMVKCIVCPKCWLKYTYQYITLLLMLIATWFAIEIKNFGASLTIVVFVFVFLSISEIIVPRLLPGTISCQDIPYPSQSGEIIEFFEFIRLVFRYTSEESEGRFLNVEIGEEETENETGTDGCLSLQNGPKSNIIHLNESIESVFYRQDFEELEYEDTMLRQRDSKNNLLHLDESTENMCYRQELEELEYEDIVPQRRGSKNNLLHLDKFIKSVSRRQEFEEDRELQDILLRRPLPEEEHATERNLCHRSLLKNALLHRQLSEGEYGLNLLRRKLIKNNLSHRPLSEGDSDASLYHRGLFEGGLIRLQISEGE